jgi:hypothetical protein
MEETISRFDRTVCTYFTLGGRSKSTANSQTSEHDLASPDLHDQLHRVGCKAGAILGAVDRHKLPVGLRDGEIAR